jgi:hypothetical protein
MKVFDVSLEEYLSHSVTQNGVQDININYSGMFIFKDLVFFFLFNDLTNKDIKNPHLAFLDQLYLVEKETDKIQLKKKVKGF